jgi:2-hydroxycyclohexanecarboxyl-CoA dehydrogenase
MDKTAFVTGGASGLGRAISEQLGGEGYRVIVADINEDGAAELATGLPSATHVKCDVADLDSVTAAFESVAAETGGVDVLVNNAGFDEPGFFLQTDPAMWQRLIAVDLTGVLNCTYVMSNAIAERCRENGYGRIINIASDAGRVGSMGEAVYSAAKGGVIAFTKSMARELARDGVTVNAVCPGPADTPMTAAIKASPLGEKMMTGLIATTPLKRLVKPDEVAAAVAYFASEEARFTTGQVLSVSGGLTMAG